MVRTVRNTAAALLCALAVLIAAPCAAWAVQTPSDVTTLEDAESWAKEYVNDQVSLLSADADGWELLAVDEDTWDLQAVTADTSWYDSSASEYTLSSGSHLAGLTQLVNAGTDFSGKTVRLSGDVVFINTEVTPIGTSSTPFNGTFDGQGHTVRGFSITSTGDADASSTNFGLFGYCGGTSLIQNLNIYGADITVTRSASSTQVVKYVGALVAYTEGSISGCSVDADVDVTVNTPQIGTVITVIEKVGGAAGVVHGDVTDCSFSGDLTVYTDTAGSDATDTNGRSVGLVVAKHVGGVVAYLGDPDRESAMDASSHGSISGSSFTGTINEQSPSESGTDRFGETVSSKTEAVGGVVGYSQGSVSGSWSSGSVYAPQATMTGGVVGSLRALGTSGLNDTSTSDNGSADDVISVTNCYATSASTVEGLHAGGGIVGAAGTYTAISYCTNAGTVQVDRWNKPSGGGIVGQSYQTVSYCYNSGTVSTMTRGGYYVAGIAGMVLTYTNTDGSLNHPTPEVYACYNTGTVNAYSGMKSAALVGQNDGYLHDSLSLEGTVIDNNLQVDDSSSGSMSNCSFYTAEQLRSVAACGFLNTLCNNDGWDDYYVVSADANDGYPQLKSFAGDIATTALDASAISASCTTPAAYTGGEAIPGLTVTFNGTELVQNADFYVVPQSGATELGDGYQATIVGIGSYEGTVADVCTYSIDKGDLANCTVTVKSQKFDYNVKTITYDDITVTDAYGNVLDSSWYTFEFKTSLYTGSNSAYSGQYLVERYISLASGALNMSNIAPEWSADGVVHYGYYPVVITATDAAPYEGTTEGKFKVTPASLMSDVDIEYMSYDGTTYEWNDDAGAFENGTAVIDYTGSAIEPTVTKITYLGHELVEGQDYTLVYGNPNSDTDSSNNTTYDNVGSATENSVACVTVRFKGGGRPYDFDNFVNMYFVIHGTQAEEVPSLEDCTIVADNQAYTGSEISTVSVLDADGNAVSSDNYVIEYENNVEVGTASYTIRGTRGYTGKVSGTFTIYDAEKTYGWDDVDPDEWYGTSSGVLQFASESGLIRGIAGTKHFEPYSTLTRAQAAVILWRFAQPTDEAAYDAEMATTANDTGMTDVESYTWYTGAANWAVANHVINGVENADGSRSFDPYGTVTREQMCALIANYAGTINGVDLAANTDASLLAAMPDASSVDSWAAESVAWALTQGVISGYEVDGVRYVNPLNGLQRIEMAAIMMNCTSTNQIITPQGA